MSPMRHARSARFVVALAQALLGLGFVAAQVARAERQPAEQQQKERQKQIEQHARQIESQYRQFIPAQLELARSTCGSLPAGVRRQVAAAADGPLKAWAVDLAHRHMGAAPNPAKPSADPLAIIHEAVAAALAPHVPADELAAFRREHAATVARRGRVARLQIVAKLDQRLVLSAGQRKAIMTDLEKHWQPDWLIELYDNGGHTHMDGGGPAADFADRCIAPHLDATQRAAWTAWSQKAGWKHMGMQLYAVQLLNQVTMPLHQPMLPADPWWNP